MINLVIGKSISALPNTYTICDLYGGLGHLENHNIRFVVLNVLDQYLTDNDVDRLTKLLRIKKVPTIIMSNQKVFDVLESTDYVYISNERLKDEKLYEKYIELLDYKSIRKQLNELSIQKRNMTFYSLGALLLLEPLLKVLFMKIDTGFDFNTVFKVVLSIDSPLKVFEFWMLFPLASLALFRASSISLFVFSSVYMYSAYAILSYEKFTWPYVNENPHVSSHLLLVLNSALFIYFLIPENRKPFVAKTKNLFRKSERVATFIKSDIVYNNKKIEVEILNISDTGMMISSKTELENSLDFKVLVNGEIYDCELVRKIFSESSTIYSYGLKFNFSSKLEKDKISHYISYLKEDENFNYSIAA